MLLYPLAFVATLAASVTSSFLTSSSSCLSTIDKAVATSGGQCVNSDTLFRILKHAATFEVQPTAAITDLLKGLCSNSPSACPPQSIFSIVSDIIHGCPSDLGIKPDANLSSIITQAQNSYPVVCSKDTPYTQDSMPDSNGTSTSSVEGNNESATVTEHPAETGLAGLYSDSLGKGKEKSAPVAENSTDTDPAQLHSTSSVEGNGESATVTEHSAETGGALVHSHSSVKGKDKSEAVTGHSAEMGGAGPDSHGSVKEKGKGKDKPTVTEHSAEKGGSRVHHPHKSGH